MYQRFAISRHRARELQACPSMALPVYCLVYCLALYSPLPCTHEKHHLGPNMLQFGANLGPKPSQNRGSWAPKPPQIEVLRGLGGHFGPLGPQEAPRAKTDPQRRANVPPQASILGAMLGPCWGHVGPKMAPRGLQEASKMHSFPISISTSIFHEF